MAEVDEDDLWYWALDVPGLTRERAEGLLESAKGAGEQLAFIVGAKSFFSGSPAKMETGHSCRSARPRWAD